MKRFPNSLLCVALALAGLQSAVAAQLLPPAAGDRVAPRATSAKSAIDRTQLDRAPVSASWKQEASSVIVSADAPFRAESREFWQDVDAAQLRAGLSLALTAPGAVVRISPQASSRSAPLDVRQLEISRDGQRLDNTSVVGSVISATDRMHGAVEFPEGSSAFRFSETAAPGVYTLRSAQASGRYLVHVFDAGSSVSLSAQAARDTFFAGESFAATVRLEGASVQSIAGTLRSPDGQLQEVDLVARGDGSHAVQARLNLPALGASQGLYELHVGAASGRAGELRRDVRTAFAIAAPTANLGGTISQNTESRTGLAFDVGVQVGTSSRYALEAQLYVDGAPFATAQSAAWLEPGNRQLTLRFEPALFDKGQPARYEVRDLRLVDQAQLVTLERRALAFTSGSGSSGK